MSREKSLDKSTKYLKTQKNGLKCMVCKKEPVDNWFVSEATVRLLGTLYVRLSNLDFILSSSSQIQLCHRISWGPGNASSPNTIKK